MLARFSLYGFLKNQRYFEPFFILFFLEKGLSFTQIGFLIGFRELSINLLEVPSGTIADLHGRRRCMILSFISYMLSFLVFSLSRHYWQFFPAMFFFAVGEAFRTGTHKAMIFTWLRLQGRLNEKTRVYGYTRSWSKLGSAFSIILATVFVLFKGDYDTIFYYSMIPYGLALVNFMTYPSELEGKPAERINVRGLFLHLKKTLRSTLRVSALRRLMLESMGFEGIFKAAGDYLQPVIIGMALSLPLLRDRADIRRNAVLVGAVYLFLHLISAYASRKSHEVTTRCGGETQGCRNLWKIALMVYAGLASFLFFETYAPAVLGFLALYLIQNLWRPIMISRFDAFATETQGATVLSIESQAKSVATMLVAPILGMSVDLVKLHGFGGPFWPVGVVGVLVAGLMLVSIQRRSS